MTFYGELTVKQLKDLLKDYPETDVLGNPNTIRVMNEAGYCVQANCVTLTIDDETQAGHLLIETTN